VEYNGGSIRCKNGLVEKDLDKKGAVYVDSCGATGWRKNTQQNLQKSRRAGHYCHGFPVRGQLGHAWNKAVAMLSKGDSVHPTKGGFQLCCGGKGWMRHCLLVQLHYSNCNKTNNICLTIVDSTRVSLKNYKNKHCCSHVINWI
jgi:hypothetical protein